MNTQNAAPLANKGRLTGRRLLSVLLVLLMLLGMLPVSALAEGTNTGAAYQVRTLTFEGSYWDSLIDDPQYGGQQLYGEDGSGRDDPYTWYDEGNTELMHIMPSAGENNFGHPYCYWSYGHAISHYAGSSITELGDYLHQLTVYNAAVAEDEIATSGGGHNGSNNFAVHYGYNDPTGWGLGGMEHLPGLEFADYTPRVIEGMYIKLTPYLLNCIVNGNDLTANMGENDTLYVKAYSVDADNNILNTTEMVVCSGQNLIVQDWTWWDLSSLGEVTNVKFEINGSSDNGYGFSQPAYFAYDDVKVRFPIETEPCRHTNLTVTGAVAATCTTAGSTGITICADCGEPYNSAEVIPALGHTDENRDRICDTCQADLNRAPVLKEGVTDKSDRATVGMAYLLTELQNGEIFEDPDGDNLKADGNIWYQRSTDGGQTWGSEVQFDSALFGWTTIQLTENTAGTYVYRFFAKDSKGASSADAGAYWTLTLEVVDPAETSYDITFYVGEDINSIYYNYDEDTDTESEEYHYPRLQLWPSDGSGNISGDAVAFTDSMFGAEAAEGEQDVASNTLVDGYNRYYASVPGGWYVYRATGWNPETGEYDIDLGGMQIKLPADENVDGTLGGGTDIYLRTLAMYTQTKTIHKQYFKANELLPRIQCPIMQCDATVGAAVESDYSYTTFYTMLYAGGNSCLYNYYLTPVDSETYGMATLTNQTIKAGTSRVNASFTINTILTASISYPEGAEFALYYQWNNFNTKEVAVVSESTEDGITTRTYRVNKSNGNYSWRLTDPSGTYVTCAGWLPQMTASRTFSFDFDKDTTDKLSHTFRNQTTAEKLDEANLMVASSPCGAVAAAESTRIRAYRMWEIVSSASGNLMIEPGFTWTKLSGPAFISYAEDDTSSDAHGGNSWHNWADVTANGGTSVFAVSYDAIHIDTSVNVQYGGIYPATSPNRVSFMVVADRLGQADAHIASNGKTEGNARGTEWDYMYDTWYYLRGDEAACLDFTVSDAVAVEYAIGTTDGSSMVSSLTGFTALTADAEGKYYVPLAAFDNAAINYGGTVIIRLTDADGIYSYRLVHIAGMTVSMTNVTNPGENLNPGNRVALTFTGLYSGITKLSGMFNPTGTSICYTAGETEYSAANGQYQRMDNGSVTATLPTDISFEEGSDTAQIVLTNGYVHGTMYAAASPFDSLYYVTDEGVGTNFNAVSVSYDFQHLADIPVTVHRTVTYDLDFQVTSAGTAVEGYSVSVWNADGEKLESTAGLVFGSYTYTVSKDGYASESGSLKLSGTTEADENGKVAVPVELFALDENAWDGSSQSQPEQDENGVYQIATAAELAWFATQVNAGNGGISAVLIADIELNHREWTPIGSSAKPFSGSFDGQGHSIRHLAINLSQTTNTSGYKALFGYVNGTAAQAAVVKNFTVTGSVSLVTTYTKTLAWNVYAAGAVAYANYAEISGITNAVNLSASRPASTNAYANIFYLGGVVGYMGNGSVSYCVNRGDISGERLSNCGGIIGYGGLYKGGIRIYGCLNRGNISGYSILGGIVGYLSWDSTLRYCGNTGSVSASAGYAGGLAGQVDSTVQVCNGYSAGSVAGVPGGGLLGNASGTTLTIGSLYYVTGTADDGMGSNVAGYASQSVEADDLKANPTLPGSLFGADTDNSNMGYPIPLAHTHSYDEGIITQAPTIVTDGVKRMTCTGCGQEIAAVVPATGITLSGSGTVEDPYLISSAADLDQMRVMVNEASKIYGACAFVLTADISLAEYCGANVNGAEVSWPSIGLSDNKFGGTFDGCGHTISGLYQNGSEAYTTSAGLFRYCQNATIRNLKVEGTVVSGASPLGGIASENSGTLTMTNCSFTGTVKSSHNTGYVGGLVGSARSATIESCANHANVAGNLAGGLVGTSISGAVMTNCYNTGNVEGYSRAAGIIGNNQKSAARMENCYTIGNVSALTSYGPIYGWYGNEPINCYYTNPDSTAGLSPSDGSTAVGVKVTEDEMKAMAASLGNAYLADAHAMNNGYPILTWEFPGHTDANFDGACDVCEEVLGSVKTANVDFTAQAYGAFLVAPGKNVAVSSNLAESYGYTDSVSYLADVSALDVLVKVHEEMFGEAFTAETADSMLGVTSSGWITTIFGTTTSSCGFVVNGGFPNDGTQGSYGYNGTTVNSTAVATDDLVEFFLYQDTDMYMDNYTYTTVPETVEAESSFTVNVKGICYMYNGSRYANGADMKAAAANLEGVSLATVNMETGAVTDLEVETDENGNASISFAEAGTYVITAYGENENGVPSVMTLTTVTVTEKAHVHAYDEGVITTAATCTVDGVKTFTCECGDSYTEAIPATGHTEEAIPAVEASCTETGLTAGVKCSVCGEILTAQETVAAKGHTEVVDAAIEPTCTAGGLTEGKHCSVCNEILVAQVILTANGHTEEVIPAVEATRTESGLTAGLKCSVCGEILTAQEVVPAIGYDSGDINGDGKVNGLDLILLKRSMLPSSNDEYQALSAAQSAAADVNRDGKINGFDLLLIKRSILPKTDPNYLPLT